MGAMKIHSGIKILWLLALAEGLAATLLSIFWGQANGLGSRLWKAATAGDLLFWLALALGGGIFLFPPRAGRFLEPVSAWLGAASGRAALKAGLFVLGLLSAEFFLFSFMFLPEFTRWYAAWGLLLALQGGLFLSLIPRRAAAEGARWRLPSSRGFTPRQRQVLWVLAVILALNFFLAIPGNLHGTRDAGNFIDKGEDEVVIYPILTTMLTPGEDVRTSLYRFVEYDDYHYGYPFYLASALVILPSRLIFGAGFADQYLVNLLLLRQLISVLPMLLSALLVTYLATRFRSLPMALMVLVLILTLPAVVRNERAFWHPDGMAVLCVVLTLFFLDRDRLRFGPDFYLAAVFCGLAAAIRLVGFFFFLAVAGTLAAGWLRGRGFGRMFLAGAGFAVVMGLTLLLSNPFLFDPGARARMMDTMNQKSGEMAQGYGDFDPHDIYHTGWSAWLPFWAKDYAAPWFLGLLALALDGAALSRAEGGFPALLLGWTAAMGGYMVYFVAVKSWQYGLPVFVPFFGAFAFLPGLLNRLGRRFQQQRVFHWAVTGVVWLVFLVQLAINGMGIIEILKI